MNLRPGDLFEFTSKQTYGYTPGPKMLIKSKEVEYDYIVKCRPCHYLTYLDAGGLHTVTIGSPSEKMLQKIEVNK